MSDVLQQLALILEERKRADAGKSYVASLYARGPQAVLKKIGEEATELVIAGMAADDDALVYEAADLWFHTLILLAQRGLGPDDVLAELERRFGRSGIEEKASRG
ncbi:MAG: phosphoribosyl-ATP diphosphatase [Chromatiales bacterium]|jgi:phosphoribosyl-ATP pyrophosphohydrolase|nr:phosphoribosyl-ATP diphosphatase [Chromatiales bacterium]